MSSEGEQPVKLISGDNVEIVTERKIAERSMLETLGARRVEPISFMMVSENILKKVLEWCSQHKNDPAPTQDDDVDSRKKTTGIEEWDQKFMQVDQEMLFEIILAANHMDIKAILAVRCKTVANMIKGISRRDPQDEHPGPESWSNPGGSPLGATNYMDINVLPHVGCKTVANMIKGRRRRSVRRSTSKTTSLRRRKTRSTAKDYLAQHSATKSTTSMEGYENLL